MTNSTTSKRHLPISEYQKRFFLEWAINPLGNAYNESFINKISGNLDKKAFKQACELFIRKNEVMHAQYSADGEHCYYGDYSIDDFYRETTFRPNDPIDLQIREIIDTPFDLTKDVLLRMYLIRHEQDNKPEYYFIFCAQHIIVDLACTQQIFSEIESAYNLLVEGEPVSLHTDKTFSQAIEAEQNHINPTYKADAQKFWLDFIGDIPVNVQLPYRSDVAHANSNHVLADKAGSSIHFELNATQTEELTNYIKQRRVTMFIVLSAVYGLVLSKYSNQDKLVLSYPLDSRPKGFKDITGCFVNNLPLKIELDQAESLDDLIAQVASQRKAIKKYQGYSFTDIILDQRKFRNIEMGSLFNVGLSQSYLHGFSLKLKGLDVCSVEMDMGDQTVSELGLLFNISASGLIIFRLEYRTKLFDKEFAEQFASSFKKTLVQAIEGTETHIKNYSILNPETYNQIVHQWNGTDQAFPSDKTIPELFQDQVVASPDHIAVVFGQQHLTYKQLDERSSQLARVIQKRYKKRTNQPLVADTLIALYLEESLELIVGMLAILKAGGAYVPIHPQYPQERVDYILEDSGVELILCQKHLTVHHHVQLPKEKIISIDLCEELYELEKASNLSNDSQISDLAYLIYTSGTTGQPKGVMIEHKGVVNLAFTQKEKLKVGCESKILQYASNVFDASVWEIFAALLFGAELHVIPKSIKQDAYQLSDYIANAKITIALLPPVLLSTLPHNALPDLEVLLVGGDLCSSEIMQKWSIGRRLINAYGPTENTVVATMHEYEQGDLNTNIGRPIENISVYVLDKHSNPVPVGVVGELYVGGAGLARGYLNRPDLTTERFILNPFLSSVDIERDHNTRLYKTGDLVRWLPDGYLEFLDRNDNQVKVRGYRIELGEIEHALEQVNGVQKSYVLAKDKETDSGNNKFLIGYYVPYNQDDVLPKTTIEEELSRVLPEFMVPDAFVRLDSLPMTINGKVDKQALPDPDFVDIENHIPPITDLEIRLCQLYSEILGIPSDQISTHQNFFKMGGNSILSIHLKAKLNLLEVFKDISVADLFQYNSIRKLVQSVQQNAATEYNLLNISNEHNDCEVAIIGISGAFSGVDNVDELWQLIVNQQEGVQFYNQEECRALGVEEELLEDSNYVGVQGKVRGIEQFDPLFWEMSPSEVKQLDPQIRKFVEHCWFALESAGYVHRRNKHYIGVFAGKGGNNHYLNNHILHGEKADQINVWEAFASNNKDALATKAAYLLNLSGPANSINTACSTGLVSVVEACKNLTLGTCKMALAGGISLLMPDQVGYVYQDGMIFSKDGHCRAFDSEASGTTGGSGVGVVLLKRLSDAIVDEDPILGVIKGYATNNDGNRKTGFTAPSVVGQSECIINAQRMAGVNPDQVEYVECHGTATLLGDPIEVRALRRAFEFNRKGAARDRKTVLGSVKANLGHTDAAAGIVGLTKVVSMFQHNLIPGQVNFDQPNPELQLDQSGFEVLKENREWLPKPGGQRLAGVSSFGIGGTNAHIIVGDYMRDEHKTTSPAFETEQKSTDRYIIPLSAKGRPSLEKYKCALSNWLTDKRETLSLRDIAYTLDQRRQHFNYRSAYCVTSIPELIHQLDSGLSYAQTDTEIEHKVVFMFPGQGAQYINMAKGLYDNDKMFKDTVDECIALANPLLKADLHEVLFPKSDVPQHNIHEIEWTPISLFVIEYAVARYLEHLGVQADAYIGHSFGEYTAATLSGVFSLEDAISVLISRSKCMQAMPRGSMLAVNAKETLIRPIAEDQNCEISLINSFEDVVISGTENEIEKLQEILEAREIPVVKLEATVGGHSKLMDKAAHQFTSAFEHIQLHSPQKVFASNVTGGLVKEEVTQPQYWCKQLRNTVQFAQGIKNLSAHFNHQVCFVEVGPGKGLSSFVNKHKQAGKYKAIQTVQLLPSAKEVLHREDHTSVRGSHQEAIKATLWMNGLTKTLTTPGLYKNAQLLTQIPTYQFEHRKYWLEKGEHRSDKKRNTIDQMFYERSWERMGKKMVISESNGIKTQRVLLLIHDHNTTQSGSGKLLEVLKHYCENLSYVIHQQAHNIQTDCTFDFSNAADIKTVLSEVSKNQSIDRILYVSPGIDLNDSALDIFAVRNIFDWSKDTGNKIPSFISISFDNYEVIGNERLQQKPSIVFGVTKSIPAEYFTANTQSLHIDFSSHDLVHEDILLAAIGQDHGEGLLVVRGKYLWFPTYQQMNLSNSAQLPESTVRSTGSVFLITGGLGGVGYAFAHHLAQKEDKCTLILLGRTKEPKLRADYQERLVELRKTRHQIIYSAVDIGQPEAVTRLQKLLGEVDHIDLVLHAAGVGAKSAVAEKTIEDIQQVFNPKIVGTENLLKLAENIGIGTLINCSSLTSILPALGNMEYTAANLYLDEISFRHHPGVERMLTLNLNQVSDTGMAVDFQENLTSKKKKYSNAILSHQFPIIVEKLIQANIEQEVVLSRYDFNREIVDHASRLSEHKELFKAENQVKLTDDSYTENEYKAACIIGDVLGLEQLSIHDDFFGLGGNSILAIQVSHRLSNALECGINVADVFRYKTISKLLASNLRQHQVYIPKTGANQAVLSFVQERLWFIEQYEQGSHAYHVPLLYELEEHTAIEGIKYAIQQVVSRHEVLRSTIKPAQSGQHGTQWVHNEPLSFESCTLSENQGYESQVKSDLSRPFNLNTEYPIRVKFYHLEPGNSSAPKEKTRTLLLITFHHIASDGWSVDILLRELSAYYEAYVGQDLNFALPALEIQFADYATWQRSFLVDKVLEKQLNFWKEKLAGYQPLEFPTDYARPSQIDYKGSYQWFKVDRETTKQLRAIAQQNRVSLYSVLLSSVNILLSKYTDQQDIVTGSVTANRHHRQTEELIGFFANTLVNRTVLHPSQRFEELIRQVHQEQITIQMYQDLPFEMLIDELGVERDLSRNPIFQVMFQVQRFGEKVQSTSQQNQYLRPLSAAPIFEVEKFDLSVLIDDSGDELRGQISYATALFHEDTIKRLIAHYTYLLEQLSENTGKPYSELSLLNSTDYDRVIYEWNKTDIAYPKDKTISKRFEEQVERNPDHIALVYGQQTFTYRELNEKSNQLARHIRAQYQKRTQQSLLPDTPIALYLEKNLEMVIAILGVLKAGGAYVPMDVNYPKSRIGFLLDDTGAELILSQRNLDKSSTIQLPNERVVYIDLIEKFYQEEKTTNLFQYAEATNLAYVIYTSGTTGQPKGVMQSHSNVMRLFTCTEHQFGFNEEDVWTLFHSYVFDFSVWELWGALMHGGKLIIIPEQQSKDFEGFYHLCRKHQVTVLNQTPSAFYRFADIAIEADQPDLSFRYVIFGGESLNNQQLQPWWNFQKKNKLTVRLINMYGITETTVHVTYKELTEGEIIPSNIGKPIDDLKAYVLSSHRIPVPIGVIGELYIGGAGLSPGYVNRPELTDERFIINPFATEADKFMGYDRLYKTGDLVRWLPNGDLEYIGRNDEQVKIRGYRIELGGIAHALTRLPGIKQSCVLVKERKTDGDYTKYLVGYYLLDKDQGPLSQVTIVDSLSEALPKYMVPGIFIEMESFPFTINGKLDKEAFPTPDLSTAEEQYVAPSTAKEVLLCSVWEEVLGLNRVGITDDFFSIGGDSILSIRLVSKIKQSGFNITVRDVFRYGTIEKTLKHIDAIDFRDEMEYTPFSLIDHEFRNKVLNENHLRLEQLEDMYPASHLQAGMLIESMAKDSNDTYHDVFSYHINARFNQPEFEKIWHSLIHQNEQLRAAFIESENGYLNLIYQTISIDSKIKHIGTEVSLKQLVTTEKHADFDFTSPGLFRFLIQSNNDQNFTLVFSFHHAITDGWSVASIISEFTNAYLQGKEIKKTAIQPSYGKFIAKELEALDNDAYKGFWLDYLADYELKPIHRSFNNQSLDNEQISVYRVLAPEKNSQLLKMGADLNIPPDVIFLGAYYLALSLFYNTDDLVIGTVVNNRLEEEGGDRVFGLHLNNIPIRINAAHNNANAGAYLSEVFDHKLRVSDHKPYPYGKIKSDLKLSEDIYQCSFNYTHFHIAEELIERESVGNKYSFEKTNIPLVLNIIRQRNTFEFKLVASPDFIDKPTSEKLISVILLCIEQFINNPDRPVKNYQLLTLAEKNLIVNNWNIVSKAYPRDKTIGQLFEHQVEKSPNNIALVYGKQELTYQELNERSNQLARHIREQYQSKTNQPLTPDTLIALYLDRSFEMIIGILGVLKAGGAYVPIDIHYPQERIDYLLQDTKVDLILSKRKLLQEDKTPLPAQKALCIDLSEDFYKTKDNTNLSPYSTATDLAYVIYTSGTTGEPKGVMQEHGNVMRLFTSTSHQFGFSETDVWTLFHSYVFDFTVWELWGALFYGGKLLIISEEQTKDMKAFYEWCTRNKVSVLNQTPAAFYRFAEHAALMDQPNPYLKYIIFGGEALNTGQLQTWWSYQTKHSLTTRLINMYGITETTVHVTYKELNKEEASPSNNIGKPIGDLKAFLLSPNRTLVPIGFIGELYIGGAGLSRGYLNHPELTEERFIANPFATDADHVMGYTRLYKTGDLARWLPDGNLEYIGRNDDQVKVRGYRIELAEIEHAFSRIAGIRQNCVLAKERKTDADISKYLVGYYTLDSTEEGLTQSAILEQLSKQLPEYMVPKALVKMESLPLTINGKLDKRSLPDPNLQAPKEEYIGPTTETESILCQIWQEVLVLDQVGITDEFFRIGGDSILSIQVAARIRQAGFECQVKDIFESKTIIRLAQHLTRKATETTNQSEQGILSGEMGLLPIQQWFIENVERGTFPKPNHWNQSFLVQVPALDQGRLASTIVKLVDHHDVLRMQYLVNQDAQKASDQSIDQWKQTYQPNIPIPELKTLDISQHSQSEIQEILTTWQSNFDLINGCLFNIGYLYGYEDGSARIWFALHHLIVDGVSWRILVNDMQNLYEGRTLPKKGSSYRQWVKVVKDYPEQHPTEAFWWEQQLAETPDYLMVPQEDQLSHEMIEFDQSVTKSLLQKAPKAYHTEINDLLLTGLAYALRTIHQSNTQVITLEGHGREPIASTIDTTRTVGWFTTLFPVKLELQEDIKTSIQWIKESLRNIPNKGIGFGAFAMDNQTTYNHKNLPPISFNYLGKFDTQDGNWQIVAEESGISMHPSNSDHNLININGMVAGGNLMFSIVTRLEAHATKHFCENFKEKLTEIITHCEEKLDGNESSHTPSDFNTIRISQSLLDRLQS